MIRNLLRKVFRPSVRPTANKVGRAVEVPAQTHGITRSAILPFARKVCITLQEAGYKAYIVGGAVRDLMMSQTPKDFDVATDATPEQVRQLFRRSRIIGRRFKIVHVLSGPDVIEVSTFRSLQEADTDEHGRITRDNTYGTQAEDATRRDFTVNALYYDPNTETVIDYHNGVADLKAKTLRMIGDPKTRYREDPVRMLRAVRLGAKLGNNPGFRRGEQVAQGAEIPACPVVLFDSGKAMHDAGGIFRKRIAHPLRQGLI